MLFNITKTADSVIVESPYCPELQRWAPGLQGRYEKGKGWSYGADKYDAVLGMYRNIYGTPELPRVTIEVSNPMRLSDQSFNKEIFIAGRKIAWIRSRDSGAKVATNVTIVSGGFASGGSISNPQIKQADKTVIRLTDIPMDKAQEMEKAHANQVKIVDAIAASHTVPPETESAASSVPVQPAAPGPGKGLTDTDRQTVLLMRDAIGDIAMRLNQLHQALDALAAKADV